LIQRLRAECHRHFWKLGQEHPARYRFFDTDLGLLKDFAIIEPVRTQFRAEFFNAFNNVNFGQPQNYLGSSQTGQITPAGSPRVLQFALTLAF